MADIINLFVDQGSEYTHRFQWMDEGTGQPISLTGYVLGCQVRPYAQSPEILLDIDSDVKGGVTITDEAEGTFSIVIPAADTATWRNSESHYDIKAVPVAGGPERVVQGVVYLDKQTTR